LNCRIYLLLKILKSPWRIWHCVDVHETKTNQSLLER
jgi:hypothetical protein